MPMVDYSPVLKMMEKAIRAADALGRASYTPPIPDDEYVPICIYKVYEPDSTWTLKVEVGDEEDLGEEFNAAGRAR